MNDHIKSEISPYLAGGLTESRNRQIEAHAAACEKCRGALAKARAKQARVKREALKKASPDPLPNLFLARQGKDVGIERAPSKGPWAAAVIFILAGAGYWTLRHSSFFPHPLIASMPEQETASVETSSAAATNPASAPVLPSAQANAPLVSHATPPAAHPEPPKPPAVLSVQQEWQGADSGIPDTRVVVIRNQEAWAKLWTDMQDKDPLPEINFSQHVVIGVFAGEQPAGTSISFGKIRDREDDVYAPYRFIPPAAQVSTTTVPAPTHPYLLSLLPSVDKKIRLSQREASQ